MDFFQCMSLNEARDLIVNHLAGIAVNSEIVHLSDALGRVAAENIMATEDLPSFSRSTVDGLAVRSADTFGANEASPALFVISGEVAMGKDSMIELQPGQAVAIPTGGMLPAKADAVVMLEYTEQHDASILMVLKMAAPRENVVSKGDDIEAGAVIVKQGQKLAAQHIGALAACGWSRIPVANRVEVAILSTGDELVDIHEPIQCGQIRDVNSYALGAMLSEIGCVVKRLGIVKDSFEQFCSALRAAVATCQLVVISGGSSVGIRDYTEAAISALGAPGVLIHGIAVKPGKPTIFGIVGSVPVFGLPGHPVAAMTVCQQLVKVAVGALMGQKQSVDTFGIPAVLTRNLPSVPGRDDFINVRLSKADGKYTATPILGKSGLISTMSEADGIVHITADKSGLYHGEMVEVLLSQKY